MWYIIIAIAVLLLFFFIKSYRKINSLTEDGTLLVAFTKEAMPKKFLGKEIPIEEQYKKLMQACYLFNLFLAKTQGMREHTILLSAKMGRYMVKLLMFN